MIPVADPGAQNSALREELREAVQRVVEGNQYILGPELEQLEAEFASFVGTRFAVGVANGTDALALALRALDVGPGDEVVIPSLTAVATAAAVEMAGAQPILVDVRSVDCTMDVQALVNAFTDRTRAVIPVHLYGHPADLREIMALCEKRGVHVIEDCSQAHGAAIGAKRVGGFGVIGAFSCYPTKNLGAIGDAGLLTTDHPDVARRLRRLRQYGWEKRNWSLEPGVNSRLDEVQAAILRVKLRHLLGFNVRRTEIARRYQQGLLDLPLMLPSESSGVTHAWHIFCVRVPRRDAVREYLQSSGVGTAIHYPHGVHQQPAYASAHCVGTLPVTTDICSTTLSLPMYPELSDSQVSHVIDAVGQALVDSAHVR